MQQKGGGEGGGNQVQAEQQSNKLQQPIQNLSKQQAKKRVQSYMLPRKNLKIPKVKCRASGRNNKARQKMRPSGTHQYGLFGLNTIQESSTHKFLILTQGQFDAMAVHQATGLPAVSLPNGANHLPLQILPWLQRYERIYLWMDADQAGMNGAKKFAEKLGIKRTYIINSRRKDPQNGPKDANDALRQGYKLNQFIQDARPICQDDIVRFSDLKSDVLKRLIHGGEHQGLSSKSFNWFNKKLKGLRRGELTILTGPTGCGKTTFLSQYSLDFLVQGIPTLWGSFQIKNQVFASQMMTQYMPRNVSSSEELQIYAQEFEQFPLYFLKYFGSTQIDQLINTLDFAVYQFDIASIYIDNLQFLLSGQGRGFQRFEMQDYTIQRLRKFASQNNVHVTIVIHPRKVDDNQQLTIASVFGSAKATQEADNILIFQNKQKFRFLDIRKNRFDGDIGRVPLGFDKMNKKFFEMTEQELALVVREGFNINSIVKKRLQMNNGVVQPKLQVVEEDKILVSKQDIKNKKDDDNIQKKQIDIDKQVKDAMKYNKKDSGSLQQAAQGLAQLQTQLQAKAEEYLQNQNQSTDYQQQKQNLSKEDYKSKSQKQQILSSEQQQDLLQEKDEKPLNNNDNEEQLREMFDIQIHNQTNEQLDQLFINPPWNDQIKLVNKFHTSQTKVKLDKILESEKRKEQKFMYLNQKIQDEQFLFDQNSFKKMGKNRKVTTDKDTFQQDEMNKWGQLIVPADHQQNGNIQQEKYIE